MTNEKLIKELSNAHILCEMFIIEAVARYADQCAVERLPDNHIIHADAWQQCALKLKAIIDNRK